MWLLGESDHSSLSTKLRHTFIKDKNFWLQCHINCQLDPKWIQGFVCTLRRRARAKHKSCLCPEDSEDPPSWTGASKPWGRVSICSFRWACTSKWWVRRESAIWTSWLACSRATQMSTSECAPMGSILSRKVPSKRSGDCGTIEILDRTVPNFRWC